VNPDVVEAIGRLRENGILSEAQAAPLSREARGDLVSVRLELRILLYLGVLLVTTGVGLFLKENHERLGPATIAALLGAAVAACLFYVRRRSPPFSWQSAGAPHIAADYVLLLGVVLLGSDLAYVETQFRLLGPEWPYHLLVVSVLCLVAAYRFDSRVVLSLALASFAAWRGVAVSLAFATRPTGSTSVVRANALACGAIFVAAGVLSVRLRRKPHFEGVWVTLGLSLFLGALVSGAVAPPGSAWLVWEIPLGVAAAIVMAVGYRLRRPLDFALGVLAAYIGLLRLLAAKLEGTPMLLVVAVSSLAVIALLVRAQRQMKDAG
jgi:Predicted membrane protein (DUF2157)